MSDKMELIIKYRLLPFGTRKSTLIYHFIQLGRALGHELLIKLGKQSFKLIKVPSTQNALMVELMVGTPEAFHQALEEARQQGFQEAMQGINAKFED